MAKKKKENKTKNTTEFDIKKTQMPIVTKEKNQTTIIKNDISQIENQQINNLIQKFTFTNSMFLTTVIEDKKIYLWDEKVCSTVFTYEDDSNKGSYSLIECVNKNLFSENIYAILPNKSLITVYDTSNQNPLYKTVPLQESINSISTNNNLLAIGTIKGNVHLFELSTGNTITIFKVSFSQIIGLHIDNKDFITTLTNESIKIYNYETLFF